VRLVRLDLLAWGHFAGLSLDFSAKKLHLVYGPNEAGKSTTRRAVHALLFGVPRGAEDAHTVGKATMLRVGGRLVDDHGGALDVVRKGGVKDTLLSDAGTVLSEDVLARMRGKVGAETFGNVFSMDHLSLKEGAEAILDSGGELSESLAVAALGSARLAEAKASLEEREARLYNPAPQAKQTELHLALRALKEAKEALQRAESSPEAFTAQEAALDDARKTHLALVAQMAEQRSRRERLDEAMVARPVLAERSRISSRLAELANVPLLPAGLEIELARATSELKNASVRLRVLDEERKEIEVRARVRATFAVPASCLTKLPDIERGLRAWQAREARRIELSQQKEASARQAKRLAASIGLKVRAGAVRTLLGRRAAWQRLADEAKERSVRADETRRRAAELEGALADMPPSRKDEIGLELVPLDALFGLDETAVAAQRAVTDAAREDAARSAKVTTSMRTCFETEPRLETLLASPIPSRERLTELVEHLGSLEEKNERALSERDAVHARLETVRERLAVEGATTRAVTEDELVKARGERDVLVEALLGDGDAGRLGPARDAVRHADALADRMRREVDRVLRHVELVQEEKGLVEKETSLALSIGALEKAIFETGVEELATARALGGRVSDVEGLPAFRAKMDALMETMRAREEARLVLERAHETQRTLATAYAKALGKEVGSATLPELRATVTERRDKLRAEHAFERAREGGRTQHLADLKATLERARREEALLGESALALREPLEALGLALGATAEDVRERFDVLAEIVRAEDTVADVDTTLAAMSKDDTKLAAEIDATLVLVEKSLFSLDRTQAPPATLGSRAEDLVARLERARRAESEALLDAEALEKMARETAAQTRTATFAAERVAELFAKAKVHDEASFVEVVRRADERAMLERARNERNEELSRLARKARVEELEELVATCSVEDMDVEIATIDAEIGRLELEAKRALERAGRNEQGLEQFRSQDLGAARAAEDAEISLAHVVRMTEEWLAARAARRLLERRIEAYRAENQGPVIDRASLHFRTLTLGTYERIAVELASNKGRGPSLRSRRTGIDGHEVRGAELSLHAIRSTADGRRAEAPLTVAELSTGTRDQLYLALRVASLERLERLGTTAPVVIDDALVHFDDDRARAAFSVLATLASTSTVIFFTHHSRMRELAREALGDEGVVVHTLAR